MLEIWWSAEPSMRLGLVLVRRLARNRPFAPCDYTVIRPLAALAATLHVILGKGTRLLLDSDDD